MMKVFLFIVLVLICRFANADGDFNVWIKKSAAQQNDQFIANSSQNIIVHVNVDPNAHTVKYLQIIGTKPQDNFWMLLIDVALQRAPLSAAGSYIITITPNQLEERINSYNITVSSENQTCNGTINLI